MADDHQAQVEPVAVVGLACRVPGAANAARFWANLSAGQEAIASFLPGDLRRLGVPERLLGDPNYVPRGGWLDGIDQFDAGLFRIPPREAAAMDPQHRVFLECAWTALEDAGYLGATDGRSVGVFASATAGDWLLRLLHDRELVGELGLSQILLGTQHDYLASRTAYRLGLTGPALTVQTACSSSLVAVHLACRSLLTYESDMALAGGVSLGFLDPVGYQYEPGGVRSPDGRCRAFARDAAGTVAGNGVGLVVLKRLGDARRDGDTVRAVILGSAVNNDGAVRAGFTAPGASGHAAAIREALAVAGLRPGDIGYVEAHGTGTPLGDPIELAALGEVYGGPGAADPVLVGSAKPSIGHLDAASGVTGLIKTVLAAEAGMIPATLHASQPTDKVNWSALRLALASQAQPWPSRDGRPACAGVSSLGIGGTNAHVIVGPAPARAPEACLVPAAAALTGADDDLPPEIVVISAARREALDELITRMSEAAGAEPGPALADIAVTTQRGRAALGYRAALIAASRPELAGAGMEWVRGAAECGGAVFMFPGQGAQYATAGAGLLRAEPAFRAEVERCARIAEPMLGVDLGEVIAGRTTADVDETWLAQPLLFVVEYALARLWQHWGVDPRWAVGHSVGEFASACLAGVMSPGDGLRLVVERGRLLQALPEGAMLAVNRNEAEVAERLNGLPSVSVAAVNGPADTVIAGPVPQVEELAGRWAADGIRVRRLRTRRAFHSPAVDPAIAPFTALVAQIGLSEPDRPFPSTVSGDFVGPGVLTDPAYWGRQLRAPVRFAEALAAADDGDPPPLLVEAGPGLTLAGLTRRVLPGRRVVSCLPDPASAPGRGAELRAVSRALATAWVCGLPTDWERYRSPRPPGRRVPLPTYPFAPDRHWPAAAPRAVTQDGVYLAAGTSGGPGAGNEAGAPGPEAGRPAGLSPAPDAPEGGSCPPAPAGGEGAEITAFVIQLWRDLLGVDRVDEDDNFFRLGGESLLAVRMAGRIRDRYGVQLTATQAFDAPTVRELAALIDARRRPDEEVSALIELITQSELATADRETGHE
jgi:phthiocerol/phenolphthiocerol synthesis type-I polyketide synthase E